MATMQTAALRNITYGITSRFRLVSAYLFKTIVQLKTEVNYPLARH